MLDRNTPPRWALVTGASSGIGLAFAERLAGDGFNVILVARRRERLEALAQRLQRDCAITAKVLSADLADAIQLRQVEETVAAQPSLDLLINNAAFGIPGNFLTLDPDRVEELVRVSVIALTRLTRAALPGMVARRRGAVINVSSTLAFSSSTPRPRSPRAVYVASKAYINAFTEALQHEVAPQGVKLQVLCPGLVQTEFHAAEGSDFPDRGYPLMQARAVVDASLAGLSLEEVICIPALAGTELLSQHAALQREILKQTLGDTRPRATGFRAGRIRPARNETDVRCDLCGGTVIRSA